MRRVIVSKIQPSYYYNIINVYPSTKSIIFTSTLNGKMMQRNLKGRSCQRNQINMKQLISKGESQN